MKNQSKNTWGIQKRIKIAKWRISFSSLLVVWVYPVNETAKSRSFQLSWSGWTVGKGGGWIFRFAKSATCCVEICWLVTIEV